MTQREISCPSCGAPVVFRSSASILAVCQYCTSTLVRKDLNLENIGKMATLQADGSPLKLKAEGTHRGNRFTVIGRIQLRYDQGVWNEWYLLFEDSRDGWLGESGGTYAISFLTQVKEAIPRREDLHPGNPLVLKGRPYAVTGIDQVRCIAAEGELPLSISPGYESTSVDLTGEANQFATLDYSEEPPLVFMGEHVEFKELHLSGLREFNGW
jgi:hypothetical protein